MLLPGTGRRLQGARGVPDAGRTGGGLPPSRKLRAFGKVPTYDVEKAFGVVSSVSEQALLDLQADLAGGISAAPLVRQAKLGVS